MIAPTAISGPQLLLSDTQLGFDLATDRLDEDYAHAKRALAELAGLKDIAEDSIPQDVPKASYPSDGRGQAAGVLPGATAGRTPSEAQTYRDVPSASSS